MIFNFYHKKVPGMRPILKDAKASYVDFSLKDEKTSTISNEASFIFPTVPEPTFKTFEKQGSDENPKDNLDDLTTRFENLKKNNLNNN